MSWRDTGLHQHKGGGFSYFRLSTGVSINEGAVPTIYLAWGDSIGFYIALSRKLKFHWFKARNARAR